MPSQEMTESGDDVHVPAPYSIALLLGGTFLGIKYAVPFMEAGGTIINIASVASLVGGYGSCRYCKRSALVRQQRVEFCNRRGAYSVIGEIGA
jgi:NAD(P)-dependent dehydrogenase (short-subunit alcohol dehydrogenase family)